MPFECLIVKECYVESKTAFALMLIAYLVYIVCINLVLKNGTTIKSFLEIELVYEEYLFLAKFT